MDRRNPPKMVLFPRLEHDLVPHLGGVEMVREVLQKLGFRPDAGVPDPRADHSVLVEDPEQVHDMRF